MPQSAFCLTLLLSSVAHGAALDSVRFPFAARDGQSNYDRTESGVRLRDSAQPGMGLQLPDRGDGEGVEAFACAVSGPQIVATAAVAAAQAVVGPPVPGQEYRVDLTGSAPAAPPPEIEWDPGANNDSGAVVLFAFIVGAVWILKSRLEFVPVPQRGDTAAFAA